MSKICNKCNATKDDTSFYAQKIKDGVRVLQSTCKECILAYNRKMYKENPVYNLKRKERESKRRMRPGVIEAARKTSSSFYKSTAGRAKTLYKGAKRRSGKYDSFDITAEWIEEKLKAGVCEVTGIPFDMESNPKYKKNPFAPSIDRIDASKGYLLDNVRIVIWQVNLLRGEMADIDILPICEKVVKALKDKLN